MASVSVQCCITLKIHCTCISCNSVRFLGTNNQSINQAIKQVKLTKKNIRKKKHDNNNNQNKVWKALSSYNISSFVCLRKENKLHNRVLYWKQCVHTHFRCPICYPRMDHWPYKRMLKVHSPAIRAMSSVACSWWTIHLRPEHKGASS